MILYISRLFSRLTLKMNLCKYREDMFLFVYNTLYIIGTLFFFVSSILYDRYDFLFSSFFLLTVYNF